ncbi:MAG TPA: DUF4231 domain-containing protein, partial [Jatrophihabitans sp.]|nr:DUF4231 domain-containing protein [Jatrophihabitans sp.]
MAIPDSDMPQLFRAADKASLDGQRQYLAGTRARLGLIVGAAACGIHAVRAGSEGIDVLGLLALLLFLGAILAELYLWREHPERAWYDGRALAESVKTLTWKYAVGGDPFPIDAGRPQAAAAFVCLLDQLRERFKHLSLAAVQGEYITDW